MAQRSSNFAHLAQKQAELALLGAGAERYFAADPNTSLLKLRQFGELMAQQVAARAGLYTPHEDNQAALLSRLKGAGWLPRDVADLFHWLRKAGNEASHQFVGDHRTALQGLKIATQLGFWFHRSFANAEFKGSAFVPPESPVDESAALKAELAELQQKFQVETERAQNAEHLATQVKEEAQLWEALAVDGSQAVGALEARLKQLQAESAAHLAKLQAQATVEPKDVLFKRMAQVDQAASQVQLDEKATRELIDQQLREAGWEADTTQLRYSIGTRPEAGRHLAIAEWPTASGPADYARLRDVIRDGQRRWNGTVVLDPQGDRGPIRRLGRRIRYAPLPSLTPTRTIRITGHGSLRTVTGLPPRVSRSGGWGRGTPSLISASFSIAR